MLLGFGNHWIEVKSPDDLDFDTDFQEIIYRTVFSQIDSNAYKPYIDVDEIYKGSFGIDVPDLAKKSQVTVKPPSNKATNPDRLTVQYLIGHFLETYPEMTGLLMNTTVRADVSIANAEKILAEKTAGHNFIQIKQIIDQINKSRWTREKDVSERQSGVSSLGTISETLLNTVFESLVDDTNFFKVNSSQVQSYGDFVLMCLPNNLWISVKSNFARERLLASGYSNDILGVGFFESFDEFTSQVRVRNFQRAGFLAMYCPDVPVTEDQISNNTSTFQQVEDFHRQRGSEIPKNINGKPFIRKLSELYNDLKPLLDETDIKKRFTVEF
ncbi:hypothetical protein N9A67_07185 [Rhodobacteraceae bacterium]|nr:hypothetical protein [Paracoccaceae bacterium]